MQYADIITIRARVRCRRAFVAREEKMRKPELKRKIKVAYKEEFGTSPKSSEIGILYATQSGALAQFTVGGIPYSYKDGKVTKDA